MRKPGHPNRNDKLRTVLASMGLIVAIDGLH